MKRLMIFMMTLLVAAIGVVGAQEQSEYDPDLKYAQVRRVVMQENTDGSWRFSVTVRHADTGWDHYADLWQVVAAGSGEVLGERPLAHPHTGEQPFTRSLSGVEIPAGVETVIVRAKCNRHGYKGRQVRIDTEADEGEGYTIRRRTQ